MKTKIKDKYNGMSKRDFIFNKMPMKKAILINCIPSILIMLSFGAYSFIDSVLSVNLAYDSYEHDITAQIMGPKNFVRLSMTGTSPINILIMAIGLFFANGIATRVAVNLGASKDQKAIDVLKTGVQISLVVSLISIVILYFVSPAWVEQQYPKSNFGSVPTVSYEYLRIFVFATPFVVISNILSFLFVVESRLKEMLVAMIVPMFLNLFLDWVFMGPAKMGIEGGALATVISNIVSVCIFIIFILVNKSKLLKFKNLFGKFNLILIVGITLVGAATFVRYFSLSIIQTSYFDIMKNISPHIYNKQATQDISKAMNEYMSNAPGTKSAEFRSINGAYYQIANSNEFKSLLGSSTFKPLLQSQNLSIPEINSSNITTINKTVQFLLKVKISDINKILPDEIKQMGLSKYVDGNFLIKDVLQERLIGIYSKTFMSTYASGAFPILTLLFPSLFGFIQGSVPIISYNFGAKNIERVKKGFLWNIIYSFFITVFIYFLGAFILIDVLLDILGVSKKYVESSKTITIIVLLMLPLLSFAISGMIILTATDYVILSVIAASLYGIILFFPIQYIMQEVAIKYSSTWWIYFIGLPITSLLSSFITMFMVMRVFKKMDKHQITLDERIEKINAWALNKIKIRRLNKKK